MSADTVLLDTNVFSAQLSRRSPLVPTYARQLAGRRIAVSPQSVAEVRYGALRAHWGAQRRDTVELLIRRVGVLPVDDETVWSFARLRLACREQGHPLHQKGHVADLWVAAAAVRWGLPLVAHDRVFVGCPELELRTELDVQAAD